MELEEQAGVFAALGDESRLAIVRDLLVSDRTSSELSMRLGVPSNLLAHHLAVLERAGLVLRRPSDGDRRRRYVTLMRHRMPSAIPPPAVEAESVLFVCTHNSARSQLAAALFERSSRCRVQSAGSFPATRIHRLAKAVAAEAGMELTGRPQPYDVVDEPDLVVSVCDLAGEGRPPFAATRLHWSLPDPVRGGGIRCFRQVREELEHRVLMLAEALR